MLGRLTNQNFVGHGPAVLQQLWDGDAETGLVSLSYLVFFLPLSWRWVDIE